jgi:hypothetical protein
MLSQAEMDACFMAVEPVEYLAANNRWQKMLIRAYEPVWENDSWQIQLHLIHVGLQYWGPGVPEIAVTSMKDEKQGYSFPLLRRVEEVTQESGE